MSGYASKNIYELLGNDPDQDPDAPQPPPVQPIDKPVARSGKRNAPAEAPVSQPAVSTEAPRGGRGGRGRGRGRGDFAGNEGAFRDRDAGRSNNRDRPVEDGVREDRHSNRLGGDRPRREFGENGRGERRGGRDFRGGRGGRGPRDDRHSRGVTSDPNDHAKQAGHGWGEATGTGEWNDEKAGEAIANAEEKEAVRDAGPDVPTNAEGEHPENAFTVPPALDDEQPAAQVSREPEQEPEPEPEDKSKSYATYLAELAEKKLGLGGVLTARQANEGSDKKIEGKAVTRDDSNDAYMAGAAGKARRERERKDKNVLTLDHDIQAREQTSGGFRGGRGGGRGGRGRGEGGFRGEGRGRGGRGGSRGESRGEFRGGRGGASSTPNVTNDSDFPTLGGK